MILTLIFIFIAGLFEGLRDGIQFHPHKYGWLFKWNEQFWNPKLSWTNKWKNKDYKQGEKFWGSSRWFAFITDGWHLLQFMMFNFIALSAAVLTQDIVVNFLILRTVATVGSTISYK